MMPSIHDKTTSITWSLLWFMLPLSMRGTLLFLWLFGFVVVFQVLKKGIHSPNRWQLLGAGLFVLFLLWQGISLFFDTDHTLWWKALEKKSVLLIIPIMLIGIDQKKFKLETWAIRGFYAGLVISGMVMVVIAAYRSINGEGFFPWSYHEFASPLPLGAIYASWYYSSSIIYLVFRENDRFMERAKPFFLIFFLLILLLLSSKLFIILTIPVALWRLVQKNKVSKKKWITLLIVFAIVIGVSSPFLYRMSELKNTDLKVLELQSFSYDTPFNGLTFRLLQWRFAIEILNKQNAWFTGVGPNSSQVCLNTHYKEKGIYTGNPDLGDTGYLGYNYHNQYLETLVASGIPGLTLLMLIILFIILYKKSKLLFPLFVYLSTIIFFLTESVLERQAGIIFFCLIVFTISEKSEYLGSNFNQT